MSHLKLMHFGGMPVNSLTRHVLSGMLVAATLSVSHATDDPYLQLLDEEVTKVEAVSTDTGGDDGDRPAENAGQAGPSGAPTRENFEAVLREQHVGTYSFYRRLPERSREEVFTDFRHGASVEDLRQKVIDRFLHP